MSSDRTSIAKSTKNTANNNKLNNHNKEGKDLSYTSPENTQKKTSLTIDIEEELARLELDEFVNSLENKKNAGNEGEIISKNDKGINTKDNYGKEALSSRTYPKNSIDMEKNKVQANGNLVSQGKHTRRHGKKVPPDLTIPGSIGDNSALRSELLAAVEQNKVEKVRRILEAGVDTNSVCDDKGRWPLHIAAFFNHAEIAKLLLQYGAQKDQPDTALERTPLLYAAATSAEIVKLLLSYKVDVRAVNKFGATCLHYAAGSGQSECCRILVSAGCDVNARDKQKMTPLHMAARVDDVWSIEVLLEFGADIDAKDMFGKTALHHAAETGEGVVSDHKKMGVTFRRLVTAGISINAMDNDGKTALYYAVQTGAPEACTILLELGAELLDGVSLLVMSRKFPALIKPFLDKCVSSNIETCDPESKHFYIQFDYTCLTFYPRDIPDEKLQTMQHREETEAILQEMGVLYALTWCKDPSILSHPVCESLLRLKWKKVKWYLYLDMLLFAVFLGFLTAVIFMEYESDDDHLESNMTMTHPAGPTTEEMHNRPYGHGNKTNIYCMDTPQTMTLWIILWILTAALGVRELVQMIQGPLNYIVQVENLLEVVLVFSVAMLSLAECGVPAFIDTRDHFAAVCLIVGWTIQVTLYGKIPVFGVYIRMFAAVAVNILKCMFTYLGLLFAFSLTLHFLFRSQKEFDSVGFTFLKTFAMMIGEIELVRTFIKNDGTYIVPFTSHLMFALFIIFISVILMCLLIALAVSDIANMQRDGEYMQLVQQVKVASQLEDALQQRALLYSQFGMKDLRSLHQRKGVIFPNLKDHGKLGKEALELVVFQHTRKMDASNANVISQQIHNANATTSSSPTEDRNENALAKLLTQTSRTTTDFADDLMNKLKTKMDVYTLEVERRNDKLYQDFRGSSDKGTTNLSREIKYLRSQIEELQSALGEVKDLVKVMGEREHETTTTATSSSSPSPEEREPHWRLKNNKESNNSNSKGKSSSPRKKKNNDERSEDEETEEDHSSSDSTTPEKKTTRSNKNRQKKK